MSQRQLFGNFLKLGSFQFNSVLPQIDVSDIMLKLNDNLN